MTTRRDAREMALKLLYTMELTDNFTRNWHDLAQNAHFLEKEYHLELEGYPVDDLEQNLPAYQSNALLDELLSKIVDNLTLIDNYITSVAEHWTLNRIAIIDKNILRLGIGEMLFVDDVPVNVTINECVEISKHFGTEDSPKFVNGILDKVYHQKIAPQKSR